MYINILNFPNRNSITKMKRIGDKKKGLIYI